MPVNTTLGSGIEISAIVTGCNGFIGGGDGIQTFNVSSPVTSTNVTGLGINGSGEVVPISNGDVVVYDGDSQSP